MEILKDPTSKKRDLNLFFESVSDTVDWVGVQIKLDRGEDITPVDNSDKIQNTMIEKLKREIMLLEN